MASRFVLSLLHKRSTSSHPTFFLPHSFCLRSSSVFFSTSSDGPPSNDNDNKQPNTPPSSNPSFLQLEQVNATSRGLGQVIFLNSSKSGNVILFSLALADPSLAAFSALGAIASTSTARLIGLDNPAWKDGLWGYNGALVGCAASVFGGFVPFAIAGTVVGAVATPVVSASLKNAMSMPQWTWSFNIVTLTVLMQTRPLLSANSESVADGIVEKAIPFWDVALSPLAGISQIFVVPSHLAGVGIVAAIGMYSPKLALHALGGSVTGCMVGMMLGADVSDVALGLFGYNSALTSMAVGTFFVDSRRVRVLSCAGAAASAILFGAMKTTFGAFGVPCLTLPFCTVATGELVWGCKIIPFCSIISCNF
jgi:urea transporter